MACGGRSSGQRASACSSRCIGAQGAECGMNDRQQPPSEVLRELITGYQVTQAIYVAASLSIADLLAAGPRTSDALAAATGTDPRALYRLLRALAAVGVFHEDEGQRFGLTPVGECLRSDAPEP